MKKRTKRSKAAAILGNLGGTARAKRMTAEERSESARRAAEARWRKWEKTGCPHCGATPPPELKSWQQKWEWLAGHTSSLGPERKFLRFYSPEFYTEYPCQEVRR